ncbi:MAG: acetyl-CoA C-acyltransferase [Candidatus Rokubacteria bacterium]|nr:acetyl-CoA C-acyltransferase [Candidatus Rokubacteria bacterium]
MSRDVVILGGARTPIGKFGGSLRPLTAVELGAHAIREALGRTGTPADRVDLCVVGHARQAGNGPNPGRLIAVGGGLPATTPAYTVQQACLSGLLAVVQARYAILEGDASVAVAAGAEHMTNVPYLSFEARWGARMGHVGLVDAMFKDGFIDPLTGKHMGELCDALARRYGIGRAEQDAFALESQERAAKARKDGYVDRVLAPIPIPRGKGEPLLFGEDEHARSDTTLDSLAKLPPAFGKDGTITAGNACGITDGAAGLVLASAEAAKGLGVRPLARILGAAVAAVAPGDYAIAPVASTRKLLGQLGMAVEQFDFVEINEAFAAQMLACMRDLGVEHGRVNVWGGAIALGHPIGMSGTRILLNLVHQLQALGGRYGLAAICGNGGHGASLAVERLE